MFGTKASACPAADSTQPVAITVTVSTLPTATDASPALRRLGARLTAANIAFDDHPTAQRYTDRIDTVTVDSVFAWLNRRQLGGAVQTVR